MGRIALEFLGGRKNYSCRACNTNLTCQEELISTRFVGSTGRAYLFKRVVNIIHSDEVKDRIMLTGRHMIRDVMCKKCKTKIGWMYEHAFEHEQRYKEGNIILERALITDSVGFVDPYRNE